jgi:hypothetical protein
MRAILACFVAITAARADEIRWTALGTVTSVEGAGMAGLGIGTGEPVSLEMSYDSGAEVRPLSYLPIGGLVTGKAQFIGDIKLAVEVHAGGHTWRGGLAKTGTVLSVMESDCYDLRGSPDRFNVALTTPSGAAFPEFPPDGPQGDHEIRVEIADTSAPAELFEIHRLPDSVTDTSHVTSASGLVRAGGEAIRFEFDPATVRVSGPPVAAEIARTATGVSVSWATVEDKFYRLEESGDFYTWEFVLARAGTGGVVSVDLQPFDEHPIERYYRVFED